MMPKFRGDGDDWLDDEDDSSRNRSRKKKPQVTFLKQNQANATVAEVYPAQCLVFTDIGEKFNCTYRKAKLPNTGARDRAPVAVGDRVQIDPIAKAVEGVCERKNEIVRPAPMREIRHVLVSNLDTLVIVASCEQPEFSPGLVDRFLIAAQHQNIRPIICISKTDLMTDKTEKLWNHYKNLGFSVIEVCAKTGTNMDALKSEIDSQWTAFCGHSGVGKTSLLNTLTQKTIGKTNEVSSSTGKGQHTTTSAMIIEGTKWIDTPGIREFGLMGIEPENLKKYFPEFHGLTCAVESCNHNTEDGCKAHALPRYASYRRILDSLLSGEN